MSGKSPKTRSKNHGRNNSVPGCSDNLAAFCSTFVDLRTVSGVRDLSKTTAQGVTRDRIKGQLQAMSADRRLSVGIWGVAGYFEQLQGHERNIAPTVARFLGKIPTIVGLVQISNVYADQVNRNGGLPEPDDDSRTRTLRTLTPQPPNISPAFAQLREIAHSRFGSLAGQQNASVERLGDCVQLYLATALAPPQPAS